VGIFTEPEVTVSETEYAAHKAAEKERKAWEDMIFRVAKRAGIDIRGVSAGEVLTTMSGKIIHLQGKIAQMLEEDFAP